MKLDNTKIDVTEWVDMVSLGPKGRLPELHMICKQAFQSTFFIYYKFIDVDGLIETSFEDSVEEAVDKWNEKVERFNKWARQKYLLDVLETLEKERQEWK